ncbi:MAG: EF-P beta-lysylation protein EpmB [Beggiatoa sp. IS2]|nr:MAG: EF-P beta-lysylation protein EpmB [Beggiatoa sp. IS2]
MTEERLPLLLNDWQNELHHPIHDVRYLIKRLKLSPTLSADTAQQRFGLRVPSSYVARIRQGDITDPLLRQVLPLLEEKQHIAQFSHDPLNERMAEKIPRLLHKYRGRVLLMVTNHCAIHCRYCFRRHYSWPKVGHLLDNQAIFDRIRADISLHEVILSGGDPLTLSDGDLADLVQQLANIPHLKRLRIHTRIPVVLPQRINDTLLASLTTTRLPILMVIHANHAQEIDETVRYALKQLAQANILLLNQSVLLRGVNDNVATLTTLSETLFSCHVLPYYLHLLDRVQGAAHFEVSLQTATNLLEQLRIHLPGYLVPQFVREIAGMPYKQPL